MAGRTPMDAWFGPSHACARSTWGFFEHVLGESRWEMCSEGGLADICWALVTVQPADAETSSEGPTSSPFISTATSVTVAVAAVAVVFRGGFHFHSIGATRAHLLRPFKHRDRPWCGN